jgi:hypothetical protein
MNSGLFNAVSARSISIPESNKNAIIKNDFGLYLIPSILSPYREDITGYVLTSSDNFGKVEWSPSSDVFILPPALQSISDLSTTGNQIIYTISTDIYATSSISPAGRSFISLISNSQQRAQLGLEINVNVQGFSQILTDVNSIALIPNQMIYSNGSSYNNTTVTEFIRNNVLNAPNSATLSTSLGYITGSLISGRLIKSSGTSSITNTGISIDNDNNITGISDITSIGDITTIGSINGVIPIDFATLANINGTIISNTQWNYLSVMDQSLTTLNTPVFAGLNASGSKITSVADPENPSDATNKQYVDLVSSTGVPPLISANVATIDILPNSPIYSSISQTMTSIGGPGTLIIDSISTAVGNRVLIKNQVDNRENGVYIVSDNGSSPGPNWILTRSLDFNQAATPIPAGSNIFINLTVGASLAGSTWSLQFVILDLNPLNDPILWIQIGGSALAYSAGNGISSSSLLSGIITTEVTNRFTYSSNSLELNTITVPFGGTGNTTLASNSVLIGQGVTAVNTSKQAPVGDFIGTTDSQIITNKTLISSNNNIISRSLFTNSGTNSVSTFGSNTPTINQVLTATSGTTATWQDPTSGDPFAPDKTLFVFLNANNISPNWNNLTSAINNAISLSPSSTNYILINIYPGDYAENNPIVIPEYVVINGQSQAQGSVIIRPKSPVNIGNLITITGNSRIFGILFDGSDGTGGYCDIGISSIIGTVRSTDYLDSVTVRNCNTSAIKVTGNGTKFSKILICNKCSTLVTLTLPFIMINGFEVANGGNLSCTNITINGILTEDGRINRGIFIHDDYSYSDIFNLRISHVNYGIEVGTGVNTNIQNFYPTLEITSVLISFVSTIAIYLNLKSIIDMKAVTIIDNTGNYPSQLHLVINNPSQPASVNKFTAGNTSLRSDLTDITRGAINNLPTIQGDYLGVIPGEIQTSLSANISIGTPITGAEMSTGGGNSHLIGLIVLKDRGGVYTDVTRNILNLVVNPFQCFLASTTIINLTSAPSTIDGIIPSAGNSRILVKDGSTVNPGTYSIDNGIYIWNGTGIAMTRSTDFSNGLIIDSEIYFSIDTGNKNYDSRWKINGSSLPINNITVGTTLIGVVIYSVKIFPDIPAINDAFYIGNIVLIPFQGITINLTSPLELSSSSQAVIWEIWNGTVWTQLSLLSTLASAPYTSFANKTLSTGYPINAYSFVGFQYRFGDVSGWNTNIVNGLLGYWARCRIINSSIITNVPIIESMRVHTNTTKINIDGYLEYFGHSRPKKTINIQSASTLYTSSSHPGSEVLVASDNGTIDISQKCSNTQFNNNSTTGAGYNIGLPYEIDTSYNIRLKIRYVQSSGLSGNIAYRVDYKFIKNGSIFGSSGTPSNTSSTTGILASPVIGIAGAQSTLFISINISDYIADTDTLWFQFVRLGSDVLDTYSGNVFVYLYNLEYIVWANGGYN